MDSQYKSVVVSNETYRLVKKLENHFKKTITLDVRVTKMSVVKTAVKKLAESEGLK